MVCYVASVRVKLRGGVSCIMMRNFTIITTNIGEKNESIQGWKSSPRRIVTVCAQTELWIFLSPANITMHLREKKFTMMEFSCNGRIDGDFHVIMVHRSLFRVVNPLHMNLRHETYSISCMSRANDCDLAFHDREPISRAFSSSIYVAVRVWAKYCSRHIHTFVSSTDTSSNANIYI